MGEWLICFVVDSNCEIEIVSSKTDPKIFLEDRRLFHSIVKSDSRGIHLGGRTLVGSRIWLDGGQKDVK